MSISFSKMVLIKQSSLPWIILFFATLNIIFLGGKRRAFGAFVAELRKDFNTVSLTELNWIGDSYAAVAYMTSGLSTFAILHFNRRYDIFQLIGSIFILLSCITSSMVSNPHWLFLSLTILHGIGSSLIISNVGLVVHEHFNKNHPYRILATTLVSSGSLAAIVFVYFFAFLIEKYNWRIAFVILGLIYMFVNASSALFFRKNEDSEDMDGKSLTCHFAEINVMHIPLLILWFLERILTSVVTYGLLLNLTDYLYRIHPNLIQSSILTTLFVTGEGVAYLIALIIIAVTKDLLKNKLGYILLYSSIIMSIALITMEYTSHIIAFSRVLCFIAGVAIGPSNTFLFPAGEELTQLPGHLAYPFSLGGMGFGMILSPLLTAKIAEIFFYKWFFLVQGSLILLKAICLFLILLLLFLYERLGVKIINIEKIPDENIVEIKPPNSDETTKLLPELQK